MDLFVIANRLTLVALILPPSLQLDGYRDSDGLLISSARRLRTRDARNMAIRSAGLLMFRYTKEGAMEVLLVHPGGPFWMNKDVGAWSIPKGEVEPGEEPFAAALREFEEEIGGTARGAFVSLGSIRQASGKIVHAWALGGDCDAKVRSNTFSMIWPPRSGKMQSFPEIDRAGWFTFDAARGKILKAQIPFLERLIQALEHRAGKSVKGE